MMADDNDEIVSRAGLIRLLGVHNDTLDRWLKEGLPFVEKGGRGSKATGGGAWRFHVGDIRRWLEERKAQNATAGTGTKALDGVETIDEARARRLRAMADLS